jgi:SH3 domain
VNELLRRGFSTSPSALLSLFNIRVVCCCKSKVIANYDFKPEKPEEELEMKRGDIVAVLNKNDPNWWMGEIVRGSQVLRGLFPKTYVSTYTD